MTQPIAYSRTKNFTTNAGTQTDHAAINSELDNVAATVNQIRSNLALIQNDDGNPRGLAVPGAGLVVAEVANGKQGVVTLVAGTVTVANTSVTANSRIFLTSQSDGGTPGFLRVATRVAGTSFTIASSSATDTSVVAYEIFEPAI